MLLSSWRRTSLHTLRSQQPQDPWGQWEGGYETNVDVGKFVYISFNAMKFKLLVLVSS